MFCELFFTIALESVRVMKNILYIKEAHYLQDNVNQTTQEIYLIPEHIFCV